MVHWAGVHTRPAVIGVKTLCAAAGRPNRATVRKRAIFVNFDIGGSLLEWAGAEGDVAKPGADAVDHGQEFELKGGLQDAGVDALLERGKDVDIERRVVGYVDDDLRGAYGVDVDGVGLIDVRRRAVHAGKEPHDAPLQPPDIERTAVALVKVPSDDSLEDVITSGEVILRRYRLAPVERQGVEGIGVERPDLVRQPGGQHRPRDAVKPLGHPVKHRRREAGVDRQVDLVEPIDVALRQRVVR